MLTQEYGQRQGRSRRRDSLVDVDSLVDEDILVDNVPVELYEVGEFEVGRRQLLDHRMRTNP